ncbi:unnamed protein product, partial [marine sediment metagenome]
SPKDEPDEEQRVDSSAERNLWATISGVMHYFHLSMNQVLWDISWVNILMLTASIPTFERKSNDKADKNEEISPNELLQKLRS